MGSGFVQCTKICPSCLASQVSVVIDDAKVECDTGPINLKPTVMFQTRFFNFNIKNTGLGTVDYKWAVKNLDGTVDSTGPYTVSLQSDFASAANQLQEHVALSFTWLSQDVASTNFLAMFRCMSKASAYRP